jgi:PKD repeat protein
MAVKRIALLLIFFLKLSYASAQGDKIIIVPKNDQQVFCVSPGQGSIDIEMEVRVPPNFCKITSYEIEWEKGKIEVFEREVLTSSQEQVFVHKYSYTNSVSNFRNSCLLRERFSIFIKANVDQSCSKPNEDSYPITFINAPVAEFKVDSVYCVDQSIIILNKSCPVGANLSYSWDLGDGTTSNSNSPTKKYLKPGTYSVELTVTGDNSNGCGATQKLRQEIVITGNPKAVLSDSGSIQTSADTLLVCYSKDKAIICLDGSKSENATEYNWSFTNNGIKLLDSTTTKQVRPKISFEKTGIYAVTLEVDNICKRKNTRRVFYKVIEAPVPQAVSPPQSCTAIDFKVPDRNDGAQYYLNGNIVESGKIIRIDTSSTPYTLVTELFTQCGTASKAVSFNISPPRPVNITSIQDTTICKGSGKVILQADRTDGEWGSSQYISSSSSATTFDPTAIGDFTVSYTIGTGACQTQDQVSLKVAGTDLTVNDFSLCQSESSIKLTASPVGGSWSSSACSNCIVGDSLNIRSLTREVVPLTYSFTDSVSGCTTSKDVRALIGNPVAKFTATGQCSNTPLTIVNSSTGGTTYEWRLSNGSVFNQRQPQFNLDQGEYSIELAVFAGNCVAQTTESVKIIDPPQPIRITSNEMMGCSPLKINLGLNRPRQTGVDYAWVFSNGTTIDAFVVPAQVFENSATQDQKVNISVDAINACGSIQDNLDITIRPLIKAEIGVDSTLLRCSPANVLFSNRSIGYEGNTKWSFGSEPIQSVSSDTISHKFVTFSEKEEFRVIMETSSSCGVDADTVLITIEPPAIVPLISLSKAEVCPGEPILFKDSSTPKATFLAWDFGDNTTSIESEPQHAYSSENTSYWVKLKASTNCANGIDSIRVQVGAAPNGSFIIDSVACVGQEVVIQNTSKPSFNNIISAYRWNFGEGEEIILGNSPSYSFNDAGNKKVEMIIVGKSEQCTSTVSRLITIINAPKPNFEVIADTLCLGSQVLIQNTSKDASSFEWVIDNKRYFGESPPALYDLKEGVYSIFLKTLQGKYCADSTLRPNALTIISCNVISPEAFTPDGIPPGERWNLIGSGITKIEFLRIRNKWNRIVFEKVDSQPNLFDAENSWDGTYLSIPQPIGVYIVEYKALMYDGSKVSGTNLISLMR